MHQGEMSHVVYHPEHDLEGNVCLNILRFVLVGFFLSSIHLFIYLLIYFPRRLAAWQLFQPYTNKYNYKKLRIN